MATIDLGKIRLLWRGNYDPTVLYEPQDMVRFDRDLYVCTTQPPVIGTAPINVAYWSMMVERNGFFWQGNFDPTFAYKRNDAVYHGRSAYFCTADTVAGTLPTDIAYWTLLAEGTSITTSPGDLIFRDIDNVEKPLPVGQAGQYLVAGATGVPEYQTVPMTRFGLVSQLMNQSGNYNPTDSYLTFIMQSGDVRGIGYGASNNHLGTGDLQFNSFNAATPGFDTPPHADGTPVKAIKIESAHQGSITLLDNGEVWAWGYGNHGQVGDDGFVSRYYPRKVRGLTGVTIVDIASCSAGDVSYCSFAALDSLGAVWMWGYNGYGQLGNGNVVNKGRAVQISPVHFGNKVITHVLGAGGGYGFFHAVAADGSVYAWGYNGYGQLGNGNATNQNIPVPVAIATPVRYVRSTGSGSFGTTYFLCDNGDVYSVGYNAYGQLGNGNVTNQSSPVKIVSPTGFSDIWCGGGRYTFAYAVKADGTVHSWGYNGYAQLGSGNTVNQNTPGLRTVSGAVGVKQIICGDTGSYGSAYLLDTKGKAFACGYNNAGQLGMGDAVQRSGFAMVHLPAGCQGIVREIGHYGSGTSCDGVWLLTDGRLFACGNGTSYYANGQFAAADTYIPQPVHM